MAQRAPNTVRAKRSPAIKALEGPLRDLNFVVEVAKSSAMGASLGSCYGFCARSFRCASSILVDQTPRSL
jgi:hypothetical protein